MGRHAQALHHSTHHLTHTTHTNTPTTPNNTDHSTGAYPLGSFICGTFMATQYPEYNCYALAASNSFLVPIWRHVHSWVGCMAATEANFRRLLALGTGRGLRAAAARAEGREAPASESGGSFSSESGGGGGAAFVGGSSSGFSGSESGGGGGFGGSDSGASTPVAARASAAADASRALLEAAAAARSAGGGQSAAGAGAELAAAAPAAAGGAVGRTISATSSGVLSGVLAAAAAATDAARRASTRALRKRNPQGVSVGVMVGGIAEMYLQHPDYERIKLLDRKGFVRIAIEHGADILPVYMFGASRMMSFGPPWLMALSRRLRASLGVLYGAWGTPVPRRTRLRMAVGVPVPVGPAMQRGQPGFDARVEEVHAAVVAAVRATYYKHRAAYGWADRELVVV